MANWSAEKKADWDEDRIMRAFSRWLHTQGWSTVQMESEHVDIVATRGDERLYAEVKGRKRGRVGPTMDALYGQLLRRMSTAETANPGTRFAVVAPREAGAAAQRVPGSLRDLLRIDIYVVDDQNRVAPLARCGDCPLQDRPLVASYGPTKSERVIVGEAPGEMEALKGEPFVGRAGGRLNNALAPTEIDRRTLYIANALLCHPPGKPPRPPKEAVPACRKRLVTEIRQRMPRKVLALGGTAGEALTDKPIHIETDRGRDLLSPYLDSHTKVRVTYHPSAVRWSQEWSRLFDEDVRWLEEP